MPRCPACRADGSFFYQSPIAADQGELQQRADRGDKNAQYIVGMLCMKQGSVTKGIGWLQKAAKQKHPSATYNLAKSCAERSDSAAGVVWYKKAAALGHDGAMNDLGACYYRGDGVPRDGHEAARWYRSGAELGNAQASHALGLLYLEGFGIQQDDSRAREWFRKSRVLGWKMGPNPDGGVELQLLKLRLRYPILNVLIPLAVLAIVGMLVWRYGFWTTVIVFVVLVALTLLLAEQLTTVNKE